MFIGELVSIFEYSLVKFFNTVMFLKVAAKQIFQVSYFVLQGLLVDWIYFLVNLGVYVNIFSLTSWIQQVSTQYGSLNSNSNATTVNQATARF